MVGPRIVTALVLISLSVGCKAKFRAVNQPGEPTASANGGGTPTPPPSYPQQPGPEVPPPGPQQPTGPTVPSNPRPLPPPTLPPQPRQSSCPTANDNSLDRSRAIHQQTVVLSPGRARNIMLHAWEMQGSMSVFNRSTCHNTSSQNEVTCGQGGAYYFAVSSRPSNRAMYVRPGVNYIDYQAGNYRGTLVLTVQER